MKTNHKYLFVLFWLPTGLRTCSMSVKYSFYDFDNRNCVEVWFMRPRTLSDGKVDVEAALEAGCKMKDSKIFDFNVTVETPLTSSLHSMDSKYLMPLPYTRATNTSKRYSFGFAAYVPLVFLLRQVFYK